MTNAAHRHGCPPLTRLVLCYLRPSAGAVLGLRVCHDHLHACLADHAMPPCLHDHLRLRAEILHHVSAVLSGSHLRNVWPLPQQHRRQKGLARF